MSLWKDAGSDVQVSHLTQPDEIEVMVRLFEAVAQEQGWQPGAALRGHVLYSVYFGVQIEDTAPPLIGGLQLVLPKVDGQLPYHNFWPAVPPVPRSAHVAVLAVAESYRGRPQLFWHLAVEMWRYSVAHGLTTLFIEVAPRMLPLYRRLGWPLQIFGKKRVHWGVECYLCTLGIPDVSRTLLQKA